MQGTPAPDDARAEQDRVAAAIDEIAREVGGASKMGDASQPPPLPAGPALTAQALENGILRLIAALAGPEQTQPKVVGETLGLNLMPDGSGKLMGAQGHLDAGSYQIEVSPLYRGSPGKHVAISVAPSDGPNCPLAFGALAKALSASGYVGTPLPRSVDPSVSFSKSLGSLNAFVRLDTDLHDAPRCVWQVSFDLERTDG